MNITKAIQTSKIGSKQVTVESCCKNIANSGSTFNQILTNTSNKLGLSKAIYQK